MFAMLSRIMSRPGGKTSIALILSYVFDWIIVIIAAAVGAIFNIITPNKRPFSLVDADISFPYVAKEKISTATLFACGLVVPAVVILLVTILLVPGPTVPKINAKSLDLEEEAMGVSYRLAGTRIIIGSGVSDHTRNEEPIWETTSKSSGQSPVMIFSNSLRSCKLGTLLIFQSLIFSPAANQTWKMSPNMPSGFPPPPQEAVLL